MMRMAREGCSNSAMEMACRRRRSSTWDVRSRRTAFGGAPRDSARSRKSESAITIVNRSPGHTAKCLVRCEPREARVEHVGRIGKEFGEAPGETWRKTCINSQLQRNIRSRQSAGRTNSLWAIGFLQVWVVAQNLILYHAARKHVQHSSIGVAIESASISDSVMGRDCLGYSFCPQCRTAPARFPRRVLQSGSRG